MSRCDKENGPSHWPNSDGALCGAGQQSPIDLCGALKLPNDAKYRLTFANKNTPGKLTLETDGQAKKHARRLALLDAAGGGVRA